MSASAPNNRISFYAITAVVCACTCALGCDRPEPEPRCLVEPGALPQATWKPAPPARTVASVDPRGDSLSVITPYPRYRWDQAYHLIESVDGSVGFHGLVVGPQRHAGARLQVAVLLNYRAVPGAQITVRDAQRETSLHRVTATGLVHQIADRGAVAIDIELPAGTVTPGTWREVQTVIEWGPVDGPSDIVDVRRWTVSAGVNGPKPVRCVDTQNATLSDTEVALTHRGGRDTLLYPDGDKLRVAVRSKKADTIAWVALVGGKPSGDAQFVRGASGEGIAARAVVRAQPGVATFVPVWSDPYRPDSPAISNFLSSNVARVAAGSQSKR